LSHALLCPNVYMLAVLIEMVVTNSKLAILNELCRLPVRSSDGLPQPDQLTVQLCCVNLP